ncbi:MAG: hypothetical protein M1820_010107 [Bogoriella megaspora]|nr:MAG: hypothetical protein M1820_010107 [Bogoriella megaspora]
MASTAVDNPTTSADPVNEEVGSAPTNVPTSEPFGDAETTSDSKETKIEDKGVGDPTDDETVEPQDKAGEDTTATTATPASSSKKEKRKSSGGVPEHKTNKNLKKKKSTQQLNLGIEPGEYWFARMKGYPPWPAIVCDEEMLPETLLSSRPVSAARPDGSYREDFLEGNKNAKERKYPIMYLGTNEFSWIVNTDLTRIDMDELQKEEQGKKPKQLWGAYEVAKENHGLPYFKDILREHEDSVEQQRQERDRKAAEKEEKAKKKAEREQRKSKGKADDEDEEMEDAEGTTKTPSRKRKKADTEGEEGKPTKTPKTSTKLKLGSKQTPNGDSAKASAKKKKVVEKPDDDAKTPTTEDKPPTEAEQLEKRKKTVLYLRHRLQKGLVTRDQMPKEEEMGNMNELFNQLENFADLELSVLKATKIHKVLKAIIKLTSIPKEEEYNFKKRSNDLLQGWNKVLSGDEGKEDAGEEKGEASVTTNGEKTEGAKANEKNEADGDVSMQDAKDEDKAAEGKDEQAVENEGETMTT